MIRQSLVRQSSYAFSKYPFLARLGLKETDNLGCWNGKEWLGNGETHTAMNPSTGEAIATVKFGTVQDLESCIRNMDEAEEAWMLTPAPQRGELVRQIGMKLRDHKEDLGAVISLEMGKIKSEGLGEVQEYIDMADLAAGMSRQLPGQVLPSERAEHTMFETWNPMGKLGILSAFNFPCAVHGWNSCVNLICGNTQVWKGAPSASLLSIAQTKLMTEVILDNNMDGRIATLCQGGTDVGKAIVSDCRLPLISFTGSTHVGREVAGTVASRFGKSILELGGNNAVIVMDDADIKSALPAVCFAAAGTAGQRCTTLRRLLVHERIYDKFVSALVSAYKQLKPGNPLEHNVLLGPLHSEAGVRQFEKGLEDIKAQGGKVLVGGSRIAMEDLPDDIKNGNYVWPTLVESNHNMPIVKEELFVPITHVLKVKSFEEAVEVNNNTAFGLSSAIFTSSMRNTFRWLGPRGSYAGIVNVNTSCSGAEIGGAFGGEKSTGGGRESGSDAWKQYMRRSTCAINYGLEVPLAQGVDFSVGGN